MNTDQSGIYYYFVNLGPLFKMKKMTKMILKKMTKMILKKITMKKMKKMTMKN